MDIDVPHHPIESRRDFFIHLFTITCGLLIALALEGLVEWSHHRELVHEARANIRQELQNNKDAADKNLASVDKEIGTTKADMATEYALQKDPKNFHGSLGFGFDWNSASDAAWTTARDTGALALMPYSEVQRYAEVYGAQERVFAKIEQIYEDDARDYAPVAASLDGPDHASPATVEKLIDSTSLTYAHLLFLKQIEAQLRDQYASALAGK